ncbi:MAG: sporulation protein YqfD [Lachnospiraceae bacterium]|nr:sporulation protein YqfD [Lachnospiraceae bacterium]
MLTRIIRWLRGYLLVEVYKGSPERFFNLCRHRGVYVWNIVKIDSTYTFCILLKDYLNLNETAHKCRTYPKILRRTGLPFNVKAVLSIRTLLPCFALFMATLLYLSGFVWSINVSGQHRYTKEALTEYLETIGVKKYMRKNKLDADMVEKTIRNQYKDIGWVSVSLVGTNIYVKILESDMPDVQSEEKINSNIIASDDGVVKSIITRTGTPKVKPGDKVEKGQVLVSGIVELHDDSGEVYQKLPVMADADIVLQVRQDYADSFPLIHEEKQYTGRTQSDYTICCNNNMIFVENILNKLETFEKYDIITEDVCEGLLHKKTYYEYEITGKTYTNDKAAEIAAYNLKKYMASLAENDIIIKDRKVTAGIENGVCTSSGWLDMLVPQKERSLITDKDWSVDTDNGHDGDDS